MTNTELLKANPAFLSELEKQRQFIIGINSVMRPSPCCNTPQTPYEALGQTLDEFDTKVTALADTDFTCINCGTKLKYIVPIFAINGGWLWSLKNV